MPSNLPSYVTENSGQWTVVSEKHRTARFRNPSPGRVRVRTIQVDGGLISEGIRADYVVAHPDVVDVIVELKGSDVAHAIQQIRSTIPIWRQNSMSGTNHAALIVRGQGVHPNTSLKTERLSRRLQREFKMKLLIETRNRDYEFSEFISN